MKIILKSFRSISLTATGMPWLACILSSRLLAIEINFLMATYSLLGILSLQIAVNLINDISDFDKGIDTKGEFGGSGVLVTNQLKTQHLYLMCFVFFTIAIVIGANLAWTVPGLIGVIIVGGVSSIFYSTPFFGLKYIALGEIAVFLGCGPLLTYGYALCMNHNHVPIQHLLVGSILGLFAVGILHTNNIEDISIDRQKKVKTIANLIGFKKSIGLLALEYSLAYLILIIASWCGILPWTTLLSSLLALPLVVKIIKIFCRAQNSLDPSIKLLRIKAAQLHLIFSSLLCLGLATAAR